MEPRAPILGVGIPCPSPSESETDLPMETGDRIILFTDGVTETEGRDGELFGLERLEKFAAQYATRPPDQFNAALTKDLDSFRVGPISDDMFILTIQVK